MRMNTARSLEKLVKIEDDHASDGFWFGGIDGFFPASDYRHRTKIIKSTNKQKNCFPD